MPRFRLALAVLFALVLLPGAYVLATPQGSPAAVQDFVRPGESEPLPAELAAAVSGLRAERMASHIAFLSSPGLEGRGLGGRGLESALEYVAAQLALAGVPALAPEAAGSPPLQPYFQEVRLRETSRPGGTLSIVRGGASAPSRVFRAGADALFPELPPQAFEGRAVFAGYGIRDEGMGRDDYRGLDVKGKVVVLLGGVPEGPAWQKPDLKERYDAGGSRARYAAKLAAAASLGARAVVAIEDEAFAARLAESGSKPAPAFFTLSEPAGGAAPPVVRVTPRVGDRLLAPSSLTALSARSASPRALPGVRLRLEFTGRQRMLTSRNVLAAIQGADPELRNEAVVIGAHVDHLGREGDFYYPGADDNASGVAALLEIARAFAAAECRPARTIIFAFWTGEEEGHLGSEHYCRHPRWPLERTAVYLNLDMIGHPWLRPEIEKLLADKALPGRAEFLASVEPTRFIELGLADWAPDIAPVLLSSARGVGMALHLDRTDGRSGGSDYREFARRGVKWVRFFGNYFEGYHEPADTIEALDAGQVLRVARLALAAAWQLAERP